MRLDAFGYVTKKPGTRCFFQEPEVWHLLDMVEKIVHANDTGCEVLEVALRSILRSPRVSDFSVGFVTSTGSTVVHRLRASWLVRKPA